MSEHLCGLCEIGSYEGMIELVAPSWSSKKTICVDICLAMEITNLWKVGIRTTGCCCGHGKALGYIGVWEEDIERMLDLGYEVRPNETDTSRRDGFYPKTKFNTRAVPDVPELVRYDLDKRGIPWIEMEQRDGGDWVLYNKAAEIIAAKDKEIERLKQRETMIVSHATMGGTDGQGMSINDISVRVTALRNELYNKGVERSEAAEAKLAQYETQEPVAWLCEKLEGEDRFSKVVCNPLSVEHLAGLGGNATPLYASPVPAADLKAENIERELDGYIQHFREQTRIAPVHVTKALSELKIRLLSTLNVEDSNDKG